MAALAPEQVAALAYRAGFRGQSLVMAVAIAGAESTFDPAAVNTATHDYGLWQVNVPAHPEYDPARLLDPWYNAQAAWKISAGGTTWLPWTAYKRGRHREYLGQAQAAADAVTKTSGGGWNLPDLPDLPDLPKIGPFDLPNLPNLPNLPALPSPGTVARDVLDALGSLPGVAEVGRFFAAIGSADTWRRAGLIAGGAALFLVGFVLVTRDVTVPAAVGAVGGPGAAAAAAKVI